MTTAEDLDHAIREAGTEGKRVPCAGRDEWTSEDARDRLEATKACVSCPIFDTCRGYATSTGERHNVWGGYDYGRPGNKPAVVPVEKVRRVNALRAQGLSMPAIAREVGLTKGWVERHLRRTYVVKPAELPHTRAVIDMRKRGATFKDIAQVLRISDRQARYAVDQARKAGEL